MPWLIKRFDTKTHILTTDNDRLADELKAKKLISDEPQYIVCVPNELRLVGDKKKLRRVEYMVFKFSNDNTKEISLICEKYEKGDIYKFVDTHNTKVVEI